MRDLDRSRASSRLAALLLLALSFAACGGREEGKRTEGAATPRATGAAAQSTREYCANTLAIETAQPDIDPNAPPDQQAEAAKRFAREELGPVADRITADSPGEIEDEIAVLRRAIAEVERTGDFGVFEKAEVKEADEEVDEYTVETCGWAEVDVTAADYSFSGVPPELPAKVTLFELANNGAEHHEMVIIRKNDGTTETFDQLLTLPEEEAQRKATVLAATEAMPKEEGGHAVADLKPGQYAMVCFIPVGSTPEAEKAAQQSGREIEGPPHFTRGMKTEFIVK